MRKLSLLTALNPVRSLPARLCAGLNRSSPQFKPTGSEAQPMGPPNPAGLHGLQRSYFARRAFNPNEEANDRNPSRPTSGRTLPVLGSAAGAAAGAGAAGAGAATTIRIG